MADLDDIKDILPPPQTEAATKAQVFLINDHYRRHGCFSWDARKFARLAVAAGWTERELAARCGLGSAELAYWKKANRFPPPVGVLLTFFQRAIRESMTGYHDGEDLFNPKPKDQTPK